MSSAMLTSSAQHCASCDPTRTSMRRLALLWVSAHALSPANRPYCLALVLEAIAAVSPATPTDLGHSDGGYTDQTAEGAATSARSAQYAVLAALIAAAEQVLSSDSTLPAAWALECIQSLVQVSMHDKDPGAASACSTDGCGMPIVLLVA